MSRNAMACLSRTDEVQSSFSSSGGRQTWSPDSQSELDTDQATSLDEQDEQSELSDSKNSEMKLSKKWINCLKGKKTNSGRYQPHNKLQAEITRVSNEELHACQSFCTIKINLIHHRMNLKERSSRRKQMQFRLNAEASEIDALNCTVPDELLNRIYFKNTRMTLKQMEAAKQHILSECPSCNKKRAELAQSAFLRQKKTLLESLLLEEKIDEHLHTTDFLTRVGEARQGLPRLLDDPKIIWKRLNEKAQIQYGGFER